MPWCSRQTATLAVARPALTAQASDKRAAEEADLAARLAHEAREEFEKEESARREAKEALKAFLLKWVLNRARARPSGRRLTS